MGSATDGMDSASETGTEASTEDDIVAASGSAKPVASTADGESCDGLFSEGCSGSGNERGSCGADVVTCGPIRGGVGVRAVASWGEFVMRLGSERRAFLHAIELPTSGLGVLPFRPPLPAAWSASPTFVDSVVGGRRSEPKNFFLKWRS